MRVKLNQALFVDGKHYSLGVHDIPDEKLKHKHFVKYMGLGLVHEADATVAEQVLETQAERGKRLAEKLHKAPKAAKPSEVKEELPSGEPSFGEEVSEASEAEAEGSKKKNKHKR